VTTPDDNQPLRTGDIAPDIAIDRRTGAIYVVWQDGSSPTVSVMESKSTDGGATWTAPQKVNDSPPGVAAFTAPVDVNDNGDVAVTYYDFRKDTDIGAARSDRFGERRWGRGGRDFGRPPGARSPVDGQGLDRPSVGQVRQREAVLERAQQRVVVVGAGADDAGPDL
jgi:hypothetical protein